jgi:hypothetical protein
MLAKLVRAQTLFNKCNMKLTGREAPYPNMIVDLNVGHCNFRFNFSQKEATDGRLVNSGQLYTFTMKRNYKCKLLIEIR